jgi:prepilin-type N-terminal cleavage/methylation domain-containing protein
MRPREQEQNRSARPHWRRGTDQARKMASQGFTLIELLLVVALILMLTSAMVFNFSTLLRGSQLAEGTFRLETLMRFARAQAANSGRKVQLVFSAESTNAPAASTGDVRATWEPDPLGQPGYFEDLADAQWHVQEINNLVQVESVKLLDASSACPSSTDSWQDESQDVSTNAAPANAKAPITFYPDGSSDSAEIIVAARSPEEEQRMAVRLVGMTGSISHQLLTADLDETLSESGLPERSNLTRRDTVTRDTLAEPDTSPRLSTSRSADTAARAVPTASATARSTVGETNSVDKSE